MSLTRATERGAEQATVEDTAAQQYGDDRSTGAEASSESTETGFDVSQRSSDGDESVTGATGDDGRDEIPEGDDPFSDDKFEDDDDVSGETTGGTLNSSGALGNDELDGSDALDDDDLLPDEDPLGSETGGDTGSGTPDAPEEGEEPSVTEVNINVREANKDDFPAEIGSEKNDGTATESRDDQSGTGGKKEHSAKDGESDGTQETPHAEEETSESTTQPETTITALEYNKVMRMLQNRDFPVERENIEIVAANAYELDQSHCAQVIDLAVDRGLLVERDGQLYRPDP